MAEIRRVPVPRPAGPPLHNAPVPPSHPGGGKLPFPTGLVAMTDYTQRELMKLGWRPGDPIPNDLGKVIQQMQAQVQQDKATAGEAIVAQSAQARPRVGGLVDIDQLPQAEQESLRQYLRDHKASVAAAQTLAKAQADEEARFEDDVDSGNVSPTVAHGLAGMAQAVRQQSNKPEAVIVGDMPPSAGKKVGGVLGVPPIQLPKQAPASPRPRPAESPSLAATPEAAAPDIKPECQRCGYDNRIPFEGQPTKEDIERFSVAMLSLQVFRKTYVLVNGQCSLSFRGLSSKDVILVNKQLGYDVRAAKIIGDGEYLTALLEYRLVLSLQRIEIQGHMAVDVPNADAYAKANPTKVPADPSKDTILPRMHEEFYEKYVTSESLRRVVGAKHREFQRLTETLEAMMLDPNFTNGIAPPA